MKDWMVFIGIGWTWVLCIILAATYIDSNRYACYGFTTAAFVLVLMGTFQAVKIMEKHKP